MFLNILDLISEISSANIIFFFISTGRKAVLGQYEMFTDRNTGDHLAWTIGNGDPMYEGFISPRIPRVWEQQE